MSVDAFYDSDLEHTSTPVQPDAESDSPFPAQIPPTVDNISSIVPPPQTSAKSFVLKGQRIKITRQLKVDNLLCFTTVPPTFDVPRTPTAILLDLSGSSHLLKKADGNFMSVDRFIRTENQESWDGSGAHAKGDAWAHNSTSNSNEQFKCRRHTLTCNGIDKCQFLDPELFVGLERFGADKNAMRELWNHELDQNEAEAASPSGIIASACGKQYIIGCSKWKRSETGSHLYWPMPPNVDEDVLRFVMENEGHRGEVVKELEQLRTGGLAGVRLESRHPSERPSGDATTSPPAVDLGPVDTGASTSGPHYNIESLGPKEGPFWEPELGTTHVATVHDAVGAGNQIFLDVDRVNTLNTFIPAENCSAVNQTELHTIFGHSILNFDSIPSALSDHSLESEDIAFDTTLTDLNPQFFNEFLVDLNSDSFSTQFPDAGSNFGPQEYYNDHEFSITEFSRADDDGLEYIAPPTEILNQSGLRASQELPPLPAPPLAPSPSSAELEEPANDPVDGGPDCTIAPRDIDLYLNERNIVPGKCQRTQSTRATDAAVSRLAKRGPRASAQLISIATGDVNRRKIDAQGD
ncbi:hypothetical protein DFH09DRAFT_1100727 [Mycena vulgaris]|nr:hypothetical protein DFH09DRAFT_1100727 [Mycena vulgaris]